MVTDLPLVSIITPSYNSARFIEETIQSVLTQDYPRVEHIVIDGGSTDETVEILKCYPHLRWISEPDNGQAEALNKGFKLSRGEIVAWLNADDLYLDGAIRGAATYLQQNPPVDLIYSSCYFVDANRNRTGVWESPPFDFARLWLENFIPQQTVFFRKRILDSVGGLREHLHYALDYDLWLRVALHHRIERIEGFWAEFRFTEGAKSIANRHRFYPEVLAIFDELLSEEVLPEAARREAYRRAHLKAALSYIFVGQPESAGVHMGKALKGKGYPFGSLSNVAEFIIGYLCCVPGFENEALLDRLPAAWGDTPLGKRLALWGQLNMIRAFAAHQRGDKASVRRFANLAVLSNPLVLCNRGLISIMLRAYA